MELWEKNGGKVPESDLNGWAKQFHLLYQGRPAEWVTKAARLTLFQWQVAGTDDRVKAGKVGTTESRDRGAAEDSNSDSSLAPTGTPAVTDDECRINDLLFLGTRFR